MTERSNRSLRRITDKYGKRNRYGTRKQGAGPVIRPPVPVDSVGRQPRDRYAADLPVSDFQQVVLDQVTDELVSASVIAAAVERPGNSVVSTLYALADRGLVEHVAYKGWRRAQRRGAS